MKKGKKQFHYEGVKMYYKIAQTFSHLSTS